MKTLTTKLALTALTALVAVTLIGTLAGCTAQTPTAVPKPTHSAAAVATPKVTPAPVVIDPAVVAQVASGIPVVEYQALTAQVAVLKAPGQAFQSISVSNFHSVMDSLAIQYGKPVTVIDKTICPASDNAGAVNWGIAGALYGNAAGCGTGYGVSRETAIAKALDRAHDKGLAAGDYVIVFVDWTN